MMGERVQGLAKRTPVTAAVTLCLVWMCTAGAAAQAATCPNEAIRQAQVSAALPGGTSYLPDCMALEMVSPPVKRQQRATSPTFSPDGERVMFRSAATLAETPRLQAILDRYVANRTDSGWMVSATSPPAASGIVGGTGEKGGPYGFAPDLGSWDLLGATQAQLQVGSGQIFQGGLDGSFSPLSPLLVPINNAGEESRLSFDTAGAESTGSSADLATTVVRPSLRTTRYFADDPAEDENGQTGGDQNNYVAFRAGAGEPSLQLLARDREGTVFGARCGTHLGGGIRGGQGSGRINQGAISPDGQSLYFSTRPAQPAAGPCGAAGSAIATAGSTTLTGLLASSGRGTLVAGSAEVTELSFTSGSAQAGEEIAGTGIPAGTKIVAVGQQGLTLSVAATASGATDLATSAFAAGQSISGGGIPPGTAILSVGALSAAGQTATLSAAPSSSGQVGIENALYPLRILKRTATPTGPEIVPLIAGEEEAEWREPGGDYFQGASVDGTKVYFTSSRRLTAADHDTSAQECSAELGGSNGCDLYLYDFSKPRSKRLIDVSAGTTGDPTPGEGADVLSPITAISGDGSHVYFVAQGKLTEAQNPEGAEAELGEPNLYVYDADTGALSFIGTLAAADKGASTGGGLWGAEGSFVGDAYAVPSLGASESEGGDGHILVFASHAPLTADDTDGGFSDVFRYDANAATLQRISKPAPGGSESPPADVEVNPNGTAPNADPFEEGRWVSEDGETIAFATAEPLAPGDTDGAPNSYLWKEGRLARLPAGTASEPPTVSATGTEVGFSTEDQLLPQDIDTAPDVYVARVDGGFPPPAEAVPCDPLSEGSCRPPGQAPAASQPASNSFNGPGNPKSTARCRKGFVRRHGRCVRKRHGRHSRHHRHGKGKHAKKHGKGKGKHAKKHGKRRQSARGKRG